MAESNEEGERPKSQDVFREKATLNNGEDELLEEIFEEEEHGAAEEHNESGSDHDEYEDANDNGADDADDEYEECEDADQGIDEVKENTDGEEENENLREGEESEKVENDEGEFEEDDDDGEGNNENDKENEDIDESEEEEKDAEDKENEKPDDDENDQIEEGNNEGNEEEMDVEEVDEVEVEEDEEVEEEDNAEQQEDDVMEREDEDVVYLMQEGIELQPLDSSCERRRRTSTVVECHRTSTRIVLNGLTHNRAQELVTRATRMWETVKPVISSYQFTIIMNWLFSIIVLFLFCFALFEATWIKIFVNRPALLNLWKKGKIHASLLNMTIAFTRTHSLYKQCIVASKVDETCHRFYVEVEADSKDNHSVIITLHSIMSFLGPSALVFAALAFLGALLITFRFQLKKILLRAIVFARVLSSAFCVIVYVCDVWTFVTFNKEDPGYPVPWPLVIRQNSRVSMVQPAMWEWIAGVILQCVAITIDLRQIRLARAKRPTIVVQHPSPHIIEEEDSV